MSKKETGARGMVDACWGPTPEASASGTWETEWSGVPNSALITLSVNGPRLFFCMGRSLLSIDSGGLDSEKELPGADWGLKFAGLVISPLSCPLDRGFGGFEAPSP